jgi:3-oxoadipate enol-lactonase
VLPAVSNLLSGHAAMPRYRTDDGCGLAYSVTGPEDGPALVLSNSLGTDRGLWDDQIQVFTRRFRVLVYDTRGHGASDVPAGDYTLERLGRDVLGLMDHEGMTRAQLAGISIGGLTALWLGVHAPDRVRRLVLANTAARIGSIASWEERRRTVEIGGMGALADATMQRWFTAAFRETQPARVARIRATFNATSPVGYLGCCAALRDADLRADAAGVRAPSLVVTGTHDPATPPADGAWLAATIPGAQLVELDAAHLSNLERAEAFTEALLRFLTA